MMSKQCLICLKETDDSNEYHPACSRKLFGVYPPPGLDFSIDSLKEMASQSVLERITVTGVQKKLSLTLEKHGKDSRFTVVGLWGNFILKPPSDEFPNLPENESTIMHLASVVGITVVPHGMIRLLSGELSFITRRVDRLTNKKNEKLVMEDFCQISERLTEDKYKGSVEKIGKLIQQYSVYPGLDIIDFFERVLFSFITGNADMHLKNYSLLETLSGLRLSPAYDLVSTVLVIPEDEEESALTINGKKRKLKEEDFSAFAKTLHISAKAYSGVLKKYIQSENKMIEIINNGLLPEEMKKLLIEIIGKRLEIFRNK
jgi:serine/threonine-protein kinase HipA